MTKGTGLGLASAYGIVKGHGGYINVESEPERGAVFTLYFPVSVKTNKWLPGESKKALKGRGRILLVDDEKLVLEVGAKMLKKLGYTVLKAPNGRKAIEIYKKNHGGIDLIILDMIMPDLSGSQAFDRFKEIHPDAAVLLSSGYSIDGKAAEILDRGCSGFIQKPFSIEELSEKIQGIING
jgi:two-component system cell cycle sensor histidine kinase/response regulator CckA